MKTFQVTLKSRGEDFGVRAEKVIAESREAAADLAHESWGDENLVIAVKPLDSYEMFDARVTRWADERRIFDGSRPSHQLGKLTEELGELATAIAQDNRPEIRDAIGDMSVVLSILATMYGMTLTTCQDAAWDEIKDRKGMMVNGIFLKGVTDEDDDKA